MYLYTISMKKAFAFLMLIGLFAACAPAQAFLFFGKHHKEKKKEKQHRRRVAAIQHKQAYRTLPYNSSTGHNEFSLLSEKEQKKRDEYHLYPRTQEQLKHIKRMKSPEIGNSKGDKGDGKDDAGKSDKAAGDDKAADSK